MWLPHAPRLLLGLTFLLGGAAAKPHVFRDDYLVESTIGGVSCGGCGGIYHAGVCPTDVGTSCEQNEKTMFRKAVFGYLHNNVTATQTHGELDTWITSQVKNMKGVFEGDNRQTALAEEGAQKFTVRISSWQTSSVTSFVDMFHEASAFNQNIDSWQTGLAWCGMAW